MIQLGGSAFHVLSPCLYSENFKKTMKRTIVHDRTFLFSVGFECLVVLNVEPFDTNPSNNDLLHAAIASH